MTEDQEELFRWLDRLDRDLARLQFVVLCAAGVLVLVLGVFVWGVVQ